MLPTFPICRRNQRRVSRLAIVTILMFTPVAFADDWPQWLGKDRVPVWNESGTIDKFPETGPSFLWRKPIRSGYAGPAVADGKVFVMDRGVKKLEADGKAPKGIVPGTERLLCLDLKSGETIWEHEYDRPYRGVSYPEGPRTTPLVAEQVVYTLGTMGDLKALDTKSGQVIWAINIADQAGTKPPLWGYSAHLLLHDNLLITLVGGDAGAVRAYDKSNGKEVWKALSSQEVGYAPPVLATAAGVNQLIIWLSDRIAGLNPKTGAVYWSIKHPDFPANKKQMRPAVTIITPLVANGMVYVSTHYEGCCAIRLGQDKPTAEIAWKAQDTYPKTPEKLPTLMTSLLYRDGFIYGLDSSGKLQCLDAKTGEKQWDDLGLYQGKETMFGTAFWVWNADKVFALNDLGDLVIARLTPKGYRELDRAHVLDTTFATRGRKVMWSHPAFANKCMIARNDNEIVCISLAK